MDRKKELKEQYKQMKPDMGVLIVKSNFNNKCYIEAAKNIKAAINRINFTLELGSHVNKELQREWKEHGKDNFTIEILEKLEYEKDESKTDYSEDLKLLKLIWEERLSEEGMQFYGQKQKK
jgi:hypothetical protein